SNHPAPAVTLYLQSPPSTSLQLRMEGRKTRIKPSGQPFTEGMERVKPNTLARHMAQILRRFCAQVER
ncbi:hypothetical protein ABG768_027213, partial [Culter alburnus]